MKTLCLCYTRDKQASVNKCISKSVKQSPTGNFKKSLVAETFKGAY